MARAPSARAPALVRARCCCGLSQKVPPSPLASCFVPISLPLPSHLDVTLAAVSSRSSQRIQDPLSGFFWHPLAADPPTHKCAADRPGRLFSFPPSLLLHAPRPPPRRVTLQSSVCALIGRAGTGLGSSPSPSSRAASAALFCIRTLCDSATPTSPCTALSTQPLRRTAATTSIAALLPCRLARPPTPTTLLAMSPRAPLAAVPRSKATVVALPTPYPPLPSTATATPPLADTCPASALASLLPLRASTQRRERHPNM